MSVFSTLLFDADDTLFDFKKAEATALQNTLIERKLTFNDDILSVYSAINNGLWKRLEKNEITREYLQTARFHQLLEYMKIEDDAEKLCESYISHLAQCDFLIDGAWELCEKLSKKYRLYIITNGLSVVQHSRFEKSPLKPYITDIFVSQDMGVVKPEKEYFDQVKASIGCENLDEMLIIGDSLSSDILGANNAGIAACWFNPHKKEKDNTVKCDYEITKLSELYTILK